MPTGSPKPSIHGVHVSDQPPTTKPKFLKIRGFSKHQHYNKPRPPWLKLWGGRLSEPWYVSLTRGQRALWIDLLSVTAQVNQWPRYDCNSLRRSMGYFDDKWFSRDIKVLIQQGIIALVSRPLEDFPFSQEESEESQRREESEETPLPPVAKARRERAPSKRNGGPPEGFAEFWDAVARSKRAGLGGGGSKAKAIAAYRKLKAADRKNLDQVYIDQAAGKTSLRDWNEGRKRTEQVHCPPFQDAERWLRNRRFEDEPEAPPVPGGTIKPRLEGEELNREYERVFGKQG